MKPARQFAIVLVTTPDLRTARKLVRLVLQARLAACGNLIPGVESHYWWQGKIETSREVLILFKTTAATLSALEKLILRNHPYDTPEVIAISLTQGARSYLDWIQQSAKPSGRVFPLRSAAKRCPHMRTSS
jgi:periplasmic divalent cation tolerance protein